jgi:hypothetical protein
MLIFDGSFNIGKCYSQLIYKVMFVERVYTNREHGQAVGGKKVARS